ncbi:MAG: hypothetical protein IIW14_04425 [Kiritimatiellae bacterium]|nr:hypothetical protein [Kiritimatiellia bacterium]
MKRIVFCFLGIAASVGEVAGFQIKSSATDGFAEAELAKHLRLVCGGRLDGCKLTFVLGERAPGAGEVEAFTSYGQRVGDKVYLWGDDSRTNPKSPRRPGTLFAVYGFLEEVLGVKWVSPGDEGIVFQSAASVEVPEKWQWRYVPPLMMGYIRTPPPHARRGWRR